MGRSVLVLAVAAAAAVSGVSALAGPKENGAKACFERIKKLSGEWVQKDPQTGKETVLLKYRVTAGGTAVEETVMPGEPHEMITLYHMDGDSLTLTHYCAVGNQPRMKATPASTPAKMEFKCVGGSNMKSHDDMHMHHAVLSFPADDKFQAAWTAFEKGKQSPHSVKFDVTRKPAK